MLSYHVKFVQTDRQTDGQTTVQQYAPIFQYGGIKIGVFRRYFGELSDRYLDVSQQDVSLPFFHLLRHFTTSFSFT